MANIRSIVRDSTGVTRSPFEPLSEDELRDARTVFEGVRPLLPRDALDAFIAEEGERDGLIINRTGQSWSFKTGQYGDQWALYVHTERGQALLYAPDGTSTILRLGWVMPDEEASTD
jgi:hypothetical protein